MAMADQIHLTHGQLPWAPSDESKLIRVFDEYDIPTAGVIFQGGCFYLFECLAGRMTKPGVWLYSLIESDHLAQLDRAEGQNFDQLVLHLQATRPGRLAISLRGEGLVAEAPVEGGAAGMAEAIQRVQDEFRRYVDHIVRSRDELEPIEPGPWERATAGI